MTYSKVNTTNISKDMMSFLRDLEEENDFIRLRLPLFPSFYINRPELINEVMVRKAKFFHKAFTIKYTANQLFGDTLFTSDGELWKELRSLVISVFSKQNLVNYSSIIINSIGEKITDLDTSKHVDMREFLKDVVLFSSIKVFLGLDSTDIDFPIGEYLSEFTNHFVHRSSSFPLPGWVPVRSNRRIKHIFKEFYRYLFPIIDERMALDSGSDILSLLVYNAYSKSNVGSLSKEQICNEIINLFAASYEITSDTISFVLYMIASHPHVKSCLNDEIDSLFSSKKTMVYEDLSKLTYMEEIIEESMRLFPVTPLISRQLNSPNPLEISDGTSEYVLPPKSIVLISPWTLHRRSDIYEHPLDFIPGRFGKGIIERPQLSYIPFSAGPRSCVGKNLALIQMKSTLALLLQRYQLDLIQDYKFEPVFKGNISLKYGLPMVVSKKKN